MVWVNHIPGWRSVTSAWFLPFHENVTKSFTRPHILGWMKSIIWSIYGVIWAMKKGDTWLRPLAGFGDKRDVTKVESSLMTSRWRSKHIRPFVVSNHSKCFNILRSNYVGETAFPVTRGSSKKMTSSVGCLITVFCYGSVYVGLTFCIPLKSY